AKLSLSSALGPGRLIGSMAAARPGERPAAAAVRMKSRREQIMAGLRKRESEERIAEKRHEKAQQKRIGYFRADGSAAPLADHAIIPTASSKNSAPIGTSRMPDPGSTSVCSMHPRKKPAGRSKSASMRKNETSFKVRSV